MQSVNKNRTFISFFYIFSRFNAGETNLIVASNVLEEGIDIPKCNMVIKFDAPTTFCSFIQSKGRARDQSAKFYVLDLDNADMPSFASMKNNFLKIEQQLQRVFLLFYLLFQANWLRK